MQSSGVYKRKLCAGKRLAPLHTTVTPPPQTTTSSSSATTHTHKTRSARDASSHARRQTHNNNSSNNDGTDAVRVVVTSPTHLAHAPRPPAPRRRRGSNNNTAAEQQQQRSSSNGDVVTATTQQMQQQTQQQQQQEEKAAPRAQSSPVLPLAEHDMDSAYYRDARHWHTQLSPATEQLLSSSSALEAPYTTQLWRHATRHGDNEDDGATHTRAALLSQQQQQQHVYTHTLVGGYFACVRCRTPICAPQWQVAVTRTSARSNSSNDNGEEDDDDTNEDDVSVSVPRGMAAFARLHSDGVTLRITTHGADTTQSCHTTWASARATTTTVVVVRCAHCDGCLGRLTHEGVYVANSVCLVYMPYRTRARLDERVIAVVSDDEDEDAYEDDVCSLL